MTEKIGIIADSTADFPNELAKKMAINIVPIHIFVNGKDYLHGKDIEHQEIVEYLRQHADIKTAPPFPGEYSQVYEAAAEKYDKIYSFHVSTELSNCYTCARNSLDMLPKSVTEKVTLINSKNVSIGQGLIVKKAAEITRAVGLPPRIDAYIEKLIQDCAMFLLVDNVYWLKRAGKLNIFSSFFGKMLDIKPIVSIDDGKIVPIAKTKGKEQALDELIKQAKQKVVQHDKDSEIWISHSDALINARHIRDELAFSLGKEKEEIPIVQMGPTMTAHTGPGCLSVSILPK
jgi:DegV family protein with EDD domain